MQFFLARRKRRLPPLLAALGATASVLSLSGCFGSNGGLTFNNSSPHIKTLMAKGRSVGDGDSTTGNPGELITFSCDADDPEHDPISIYWVPSAADARQTGTAAAAAPTTTPSASSSTTTTPTATASAAATPSTTPTATTSANPATPAPDTTPVPGSDTSPVYTWQVPPANNVEYTITCTVRDDRGKSTSRSVKVVVGTPASPAASPTPAPTAAPSPASSPAATAQ